jgi:hypothetical protein
LRAHSGENYTQSPPALRGSVSPNMQSWGVSVVVFYPNPSATAGVDGGLQGLKGDALVAQADRSP